MVETHSLILLRWVKVYIVGGLWFETGLIVGLFSKLIGFFFPQVSVELNSGSCCLSDLTEYPSKYIPFYDYKFIFVTRT